MRDLVQACAETDAILARKRTHTQPQVRNSTVDGFDYRYLDEDAKRLQARITALASKTHPTPDERDEVTSLMGQLKTLEDVASKMKDAEIRELNAVVARGHVVGDGASYAAGAEVADFMNYVRSGEIRNTLSVGSDANGGYIVPEPEHQRILEKARRSNPVLARATRFDLSGGDTTTILPHLASHIAVANATETGARSEQSGPTFTGPTLVCYDYYSDVRPTRQWLDSVPSADSMLTTWGLGSIYEQFGADLVSGDGITRAKGLFSETTTYSHVPSGHDDALLATSFATLFFALPAAYRSAAVWIMSSATLALANSFTDPSAADTRLVDWSSGVPRIMGHEVLEADSAPAIGAGTFPVAFGDIEQAYAIGTHRVPSVLRDELTVVPLVKFYFLARLGGCAWNGDACVLMECAAS